MPREFSENHSVCYFFFFVLLMFFFCFCWFFVCSFVRPLFVYNSDFIIHFITIYDDDELMLRVKSQPEGSGEAGASGKCKKKEQENLLAVSRLLRTRAYCKIS